MTKKRITVLFLLMCLLLSTVHTAFASDWYSYTYNFWGEEVESPDAYSVTNVLYGTNWEEVGAFKNPEGIFTVGDSVFICDTGNNRIVELLRKDGTYEFVRVIYSVQVAQDLAEQLTVDGNITLTFNTPTDIYVMPITDEERLEVFGEYTGEMYEVPVTEEPAEDETGDETGEEPAEDETGDETGEEPAEDETGSSSESEDAAEAEAADGETEDGETADGETGDGEAADGEAGDGESGETVVVPYRENIIGQELDLEYDFYIADCQNNRILHCDYNLNVIGVIQNPEDDTLADNYEFLPCKLVADAAYRVYVQATGINSGLMEFDKTGTFTSYVGANKVQVSIVDKIWRKLQTQAQKDRTVQYVPTEYNNLSLDSKGFIYVTTHTLEDDDIWAGTATPVRKLNSMGSDILVRNGNAYPSGDLVWGTAGGISGASMLIDVIAFANDTYACLDRARGRLFVYDFQGNMLCAFGNYGSVAGCFTFPTGMDNPDEETILVLDRQGSVTEFSMTNYGRMINEALAEYKVGHYDESAEIWQEVLKYNGNNELAYVGIGRALLRNGQYKEAMEYFEVARDEVNYSKAFKHYREQVVEEYIGVAVVALAVLIIVPKLIRGTIKLRKEIREA